LTTFTSIMKPGKNWLFTLILVVIAVFIHLYSTNSLRVENQFSGRIYPAFGRFLRHLFGWIPFSIGDVLYGLLILWLTWKMVKALKAFIKKEVTLQRLSSGAGKAVRILIIVYILFNAFWGINYNRVGIAGQMELTMDKYSATDLQVMNGLLVEKVNATKKALVNRHEKYPAKKELFKKVADAYRQAAAVYPFLQYRPVSLKPSVWSLVGNYMGFTGYYNPFTGEGQVNTLVPKFLQPFTTCHEVAHQLGYAKEREASFVAYLAATASQDTLLHYSVYLDLYMYSNRNLFETDSTAARKFNKKLLPEVLTDLEEWRAFNKKYRNPVEPVFRWIYGVYLKQNQQPQGVLSYDEVTGFMISYYKKYGKI